MHKKKSAGARLGTEASAKAATGITAQSDAVGSTKPAFEKISIETGESATVEKGSTSARKLLRQANAHASCNPNVVALHNSTLALSRIVRYQDEVGSSRLKVCFPNGVGRKDDEHDLTPLLGIPNIVDAFSEGFKQRCQNMKPASRAKNASALKSGFISYLADRMPNISLPEIDSAMLRGFEKWVNENPGNSGRPVKPATAEVYHGSVRTIFETLKDVPRFASDAARIFSQYPKRTNPGSTERTESFERISRENLEKVDQAVQTNLMEIRDRWQRGKRLIESGTQLIEEGSADNNQLSVALAKIAGRYAGIPTGTDLKQDDPDLFRATDKKGGHTLSAISSYLSVQSADLVPFVLLLILETGWNAEGVLALKWSSIRTIRHLGKDVIRIVATAEEDVSPAPEPTVLEIQPKKDRSTQDITKYLDLEWIGPWLELLKEMTVRIRPYLPHHLRDCVFCSPVLRPKNGQRAATYASESRGAAGSTLWKNQLAHFRRRHELPNFTLSNIRKTEGDEVGIRHGSLVQGQALNHGVYATTERNYVGTPVMRREQEQLARTVHMYERFARTGGAIDTRRNARTPSMDKDAATPGYTCGDAYDSPRLGQTAGRMCTAYGECPGCPLGWADLNDPFSVAYYLALRKAIVDGQHTVAPQAWLNRWASVLLSLDNQLGHVPKLVLDKARALRVRLPPIG